MPVVVRDANDDDAAALTDLWTDLVNRPGTTSSAAPDEVIRKAVARVDGDPESRILVAELDDQVVGCAYLRVVASSPLHDDRVVRISHLQVDPAYSRQGAGRSLVTAALAWAEQEGVESLVVLSPVNDRDANRVLARLGLAQVAGLRGAPVAALRARLPHDTSVAARQQTRSGRNVGQVVAARRSQRRARVRRVAL